MSDDLKFPNVPQGRSKLATEEDIVKDVNGITNPNLHRRVDAAEPEKDSDEYKPRDYSFTVHNLNSYRTTTINHHDEESETCEIP